MADEPTTTEAVAAATVSTAALAALPANPAPKPDTPHYKRGHRCPEPTATHPCVRWETLYVWEFIKRFTTLLEDVVGLITIEDLENALLDESGTANVVLEPILVRFLRALRPGIRNTDSRHLPNTIRNFLIEYPKDYERTFYYDEINKTYTNPLDDDGGFWAAPWGLKLNILRTLVDWQLTSAPRVRDIIDIAWSAKQRHHKRKADPPKPPPPPEDPFSKDSLTVKFIGMDQTKTRFWSSGDGSRLYTTTNPWKTNQTFVCISKSKEDWIKWIDMLRAQAPPEPEEGNTDRNRNHQNHWDLIYALEMRVDSICKEEERVQRVREEHEATLKKRREELARELASHRSASDTDMVDADESGADNDSVAADNTNNNENGEHDGDDDEEIDELEDDTDGEHVTKQDIDKSFFNLNGKPSTNGKKRTRPVPDKDLRRSSRSKRLKTEDTRKAGSQQRNGVSAKTQKAKDGTFWYFGSPSDTPAKRPDMLDDPDAVLRSKRNSTSKAKRSPSPDAADDDQSVHSDQNEDPDIAIVSEPDYPAETVVSV